jgi:hypothetical protein
VSVTAEAEDALGNAEVITVAENASLYAAVGTGAGAGVYVKADGALYLGGGVTFKQSPAFSDGTVYFPSSIGPKGEISLKEGETIAFATDNSDIGQLEVNSGSVLIIGTKATTFPGKTRINAITTDSAGEGFTLVADLSVPAGGAFHTSVVEVKLAATTGAGTDAAVTAKLILGDKAKLWGTVVAGTTTISGGGAPTTGGWQAVTSATIEATGAETATLSGTLKAGDDSGSAITVGAGTSAAGGILTLADKATLHLGGPTADLINTSLRGARLTLENDGTGPGTLKFEAASSKVLLGKAEGGESIGGTGLGSLKFGNVAVTAAGTLVPADVLVVTSGEAEYAVQLGGTSGGSLAAGETANVVISNNIAVTNGDE